MEDCATTSSQGAQPPHQLPSTFKRLVAASTGGSFSEVARVAEAPMVLPGPGEVGAAGLDSSRPLPESGTYTPSRLQAGALAQITYRAGPLRSLRAPKQI